MPDKNVADALQRVPGVNISSASASEGGFDENDRVSMRGTNPSLTQTLINGHAVATGDWFVLDQVGTVGRSVSYTLLPSELVGQVVVHKSARPHWSKAASPARSTSSRASRWTSPSRSRSKASSAASTRTCRTRPIRSSAGCSTGRTTPTPSACWCRSSPRSATCAATARRSWLRQICAGQRGRVGASGPGQRVLPDAHRLGAVRAEARAPGRPDRHPVQADRQPRRSTSRLLLDSRRQLQPQLHAVGQPAHRHGQPRPTGLRGAATARWSRNCVDRRRAGHQCSTAIVRPDLAPGAQLETEFVNLDGDWRATDTLQLQRPARRDQGQRRDADAGRVRMGDVLSTGASWTHATASARRSTGRSAATTPPSGTGTSLDWIFGASTSTSKDKEN